MRRGPSRQPGGNNYLFNSERPSRTSPTFHGSRRKAAAGSKRPAANSYTFRDSAGRRGDACRRFYVYRSSGTGRLSVTPVDRLRGCDLPSATNAGCTGDRGIPGGEQGPDHGGGGDRRPRPRRSGHWGSAQRHRVDGQLFAAPASVPTDTFAARSETWSRVRRALVHGSESRTDPPVPSGAHATR